MWPFLALCQSRTNDERRTTTDDDDNDDGDDDDKCQKGDMVLLNLQ